MFKKKAEDIIYKKDKIYDYAGKGNLQDYIYDLEYRIQKQSTKLDSLELKVFHLEFMEQASALMKEYVDLNEKLNVKEYAPVIYLQGVIYINGCSYDVKTFDCTYVCPLRKQLLDQLQKGKKK